MQLIDARLGGPLSELAPVLSRWDTLAVNNHGPLLGQLLERAGTRLHGSDTRSLDWRGALARIALVLARHRPKDTAEALARRVVTFQATAAIGAQLHKSEAQPDMVCIPETHCV
jgi:hypothetical protein